MFVGSSLLSVKHTCHSSYQGKDSSNPADFNGLGYITATWTQDGKNVVSLTHNEYHAERFPGMCIYQTSMQCWYNSIIGLKSSDGGVTFAAPFGIRLVAAAPLQQRNNQGRPRGFFNPSNIVHKGGFYYTIIGAGGTGDQASGICLFRTSNVYDLTAWRGYDGNGFESHALNPYGNSATSYVPCEPLGLGGIPGSISYYEPSGLFVAVFPFGPTAAYPDGGIAYQWSADLIHWGRMKTLVGLPNMEGPDCSIPIRYGYVSMADPDSTSRNFDTIGSKPYLFLTRFHTDGCNLTPNRDLVAIPLEVTSGG
jgi:hypothetical protein